MGGTQPQAGGTEVAVVVLQYLTSHGFERSTKAFRKDAKALLAPVKALPQGVRPLGAIIAEFCELKEAQQRRAQLLSANAALSEINDVIERHACGEAHPAAPPMPAAPADRPAATDATPADFAAQQAAGAQAASPNEQDPQQGPSGGQQLPPQQEAASQPAQVLSPRKALRKRAPKRKRAAEQAAAQQAEAISGGSFSELLNQPINQRAFEQLLAGDWQGRFAEGLASCINSRMGPSEEQQQQPDQQLLADEARRIADAAAAAAGPPQASEEADVMSWVESLTEDPGMAALLQPMIEQEPQAAAEPFSAAQQNTQQQAVEHSALAPTEPLQAPDPAFAAWQNEPMNSLQQWASAVEGISASQSAAATAVGSEAAVGEPAGSRVAASPQEMPARKRAAYGDGSSAVHVGQQVDGGTAQHVDMAAENPGAGSCGMPGNMAAKLSSIFSSGCAESTMEAFLSTLSYR